VNQEFTSGEVQEPPSIGLRTVLCIALTTYSVVRFCRIGVKSLLEAFAEESGLPKVQVTAQPKKTEAGNPDFQVWDGKQHIIGYKDHHSGTRTKSKSTAVCPARG
jgi:hypothetical protein